MLKLSKPKFVNLRKFKMNPILVMVLAGVAKAGLAAVGVGV